MSAAEALALLCQERSLPLDVIRGPSRKTEHVRLRWWLARELEGAGFGQSEIARAMKKHPSSINNGLHGGKGMRKRHISPPQMDVVCSCHRRAA